MNTDSAHDQFDIWDLMQSDTNILQRLKIKKKFNSFF